MGMYCISTDRAKTLIHIFCWGGTHIYIYIYIMCLLIYLFVIFLEGSMYIGCESNYLFLKLLVWGSRALQAMAVTK